MKKFCLFFIAVIVVFAAGCGGGERAVSKDPRFERKGDKTIKDALTGMVWTENAFTPGPEDCRPGETRTWQGALDYIRCLNEYSFLGYEDWRLPSVYNLESLLYPDKTLNFIWLEKQGFKKLQAGWYWSSTAIDEYPDYAWVVSMNYTIGYRDNKKYKWHVWPVRGGK